MGFFTAVSGYVAIVRRKVTQLRDGLALASETIAEWLETGDQIYTAISAVVEPWRLGLYLLVAMMLIYAYCHLDKDGVTSPSSTPGSS